MKFSKKRFLASKEGKRLKHLLKGDLDILDGMEVVEDDDYTGFGSIFYEEDGEEYVLYPVLEEWCET